MGIASAQSLRWLRPVEPFEERTVFDGMSYGLSSCGYDIRLDQDIDLVTPTFDGFATVGSSFALGSSIERFNMPNNLVGFVKDKSSLARQGLSVFNTVIEPGWSGYLTLELVLHGDNYIRLKRGQPIAQVVFQFLDFHTDQPYTGKYQNQERGPQHARRE